MRTLYVTQAPSPGQWTWFPHKVSEFSLVSELMCTAGKLTPVVDNYINHRGEPPAILT